MQARSIETRAALLDAAIECVCDKGYKAVTTTDIAQRAGVSRGAQLYHFPTKAELMTAALEHLLERRVREFREVFGEQGSSVIGLRDLVERLWSMFDGPVFTAWVELWIAARTERGLAAVIVELDRRFTDETRLLAAEVLPSAPSLDPYAVELARDVAFAMLTGVALQRLVPRGQRPAADYLVVLSRTIADVIGTSMSPVLRR